MMEYIPCYSAPAVHLGLLPATRLASRIILIEQNIKKGTGPPPQCIKRSPASRGRSRVGPVLNVFGLFVYNCIITTEGGTRSVPVHIHGVCTLHSVILTTFLLRYRGNEPWYICTAYRIAYSLQYNFYNSGVGNRSAPVHTLSSLGSSAPEERLEPEVRQTLS
jgi:hypothetical protein